MSDPYESVIDYDREEAQFARHLADRLDPFPPDDGPTRQEIEESERDWCPLHAAYHGRHIG